MIVERLKVLKEINPEVEGIVDEIIQRYERLVDDVCAAASFHGHERINDIIEEELEES